MTFVLLKWVRERSKRIVCWCGEEVDGRVSGSGLQSRNGACKRSNKKETKEIKDLYMGTLVLQAQDQLSPHYNSSTKMGLFSPHHASTTKQRRKPQRTASTSSYFSPNPTTYAERNSSEIAQFPAREKSPAILSFASSKHPASSKALQSLSASETFRPVSVVGLKPYFQSGCVSIADREQPRRPNSASGRVYPEALQSSQLRENSLASAKVTVSRNSSSNRPKSSPEIMAKKQAQYFKSTKKVVGSLTLTDKSNPGSVINKKILQRTGVSNTDAVRSSGSQNVSMKVTILQRPKTKEDALRNLSKLTGAPLAYLFAKNGLASPFPGNDPAIADNKNLAFTSLAAGKDRNYTRDEANESIKSSQILFVSSQELTDPTDPFSAVQEQESLDLEEDDSFGIQEGGRSISVDTDQFPIQEEGRSIPVDSIPCLPIPFTIDCNGLSAVALLSDAEFLAEKWAGPCFSISPPPSSLPIPKFASLTRHKTAIPEIESADDLEGVSSSGSASAPASPLEEALWLMNNSRAQEVKKNILDTAVATKDLRRLLKLAIP
ncbi:hypothetical protein O6H91_10G017100 [Diphasiastrum complanatum]|uniref:Uncharacterized protein n=1 Tax=Diphasiastrum complanatum TaxID=34168 RepID=A0ACC2CFM3_DIPCM|nr:hypothetical protein O6H91_10G017100 [Diphasiastrum complanatum]